jgi:hypothetical protein
VWTGPGSRSGCLVENHRMRRSGSAPSAPSSSPGLEDDACNVDFSPHEPDEEEHVIADQSQGRPHFYGEEIEERLRRLDQFVPDPLPPALHFHWQPTFEPVRPGKRW